MTLQITIPDSMLQAIRLPESQVKQEVLKELAVALYSQELLPFNQARELAQMDSDKFGELLGERCVYRHCGRVSIAQDLACCSE